MRPITVVVKGYGYWGTILARVFAAHPGFNLLRVEDSDPVRQIVANEMYGWDTGVPLAVVIATPANTHAAVARQALMLGQHVWVEKPAATTLLEYYSMSEMAQEMNLTLFTDHTYVHHPAIKKMKALMPTGDFDYYVSKRLNKTTHRTDTDVLGDLIPHDLAILDVLLDGQEPTNVRWRPGDAGEGHAFLDWATHDFAADIWISWNHERKVREIALLGEHDELAFTEDGLGPRLDRTYSSGLGHPVDIPTVEPLREAAWAFFDEISGTRIRDKQQAARILRTIDRLRGIGR